MRKPCLRLRRSAGAPQSHNVIDLGNGVFGGLVSHGGHRAAEPPPCLAAGRFRPARLLNTGWLLLGRRRGGLLAVRPAAAPPAVPPFASAGAPRRDAPPGDDDLGDGILLAHIFRRGSFVAALIAACLGDYILACAMLVGHVMSVAVFMGVD